MKNLILLILLTSLYANAAIKTRIMHIQNAIDSPQELEVYVTYGGRVFNVEKENVDIISDLEYAYTHNLEIEIEIENGEIFDVLNEVEKITKVTMATLRNREATPKKSKSQKNQSVNPMSGYTPSNVESYRAAYEIFMNLSVGQMHRGRSECFNRAYLWSKKMYDDKNIKSMKIFIFYTAKYRREIIKKWWFHVAPMILIQGELYVMDKEFTRAPTSAVGWEQKFGANRIGDRRYRCPNIKNISEFYDRKNMETSYCNILHASMFYWGPNDLKATSEKGTLATAFKNWKIRAAAKQGFKNWQNVYKVRRIQ